MRISYFFLTVVCCGIIVCLVGCGPPQSQTEQFEQPVFERQEDFRWPKGKRAAISLTFDDARSIAEFQSSTNTASRALSTSRLIV